MKAKERVQTAFALDYPDRPPILGGWLAAPEHIWTLTGCSEDEYWEDPFFWGLEAEKILGSDAVVAIFEPIARGSYRCVDGRVLELRAGYTIEGVLEYIEKLPEPGSLPASFDEDAEYANFVEEFQAKKAQCGDILWCPADWFVIPMAPWVYEFGYENALITLAKHPDQYRKLIRYSAERGRLRARASEFAALHLRQGCEPGLALSRGTGSGCETRDSPGVPRPFEQPVRSCGRRDQEAAWRQLRTPSGKNAGVPAVDSVAQVGSRNPGNRRSGRCGVWRMIWLTSLREEGQRRPA